MSSKFFRVDGADQESGEETYLVLQATTRPQAEKLAREQGLMVASVREALADDWSAPPEEPAPVPDIQFHEDETMTADSPAHQQQHGEGEEPEAFVEPAPTAHAPAHYTLEPGASRTADTDAAPASEPSNASAMVLACAGGAIVLGGVLALTLALWPDNAVRNDLQQLDYRLHALIQTVVGSALLLGGLMVFLIAVLCYFAPRRGE